MPENKTTKPMSHVLVVSADPGWREEVVAGINAAAQKLDNPFGLLAVPAADAAALLRAAGGRPSDALRLASQGQSPKAWSLLPKAMSRGEVGALSDHAPAQAIGALQKLCHDLMAVDCGALPRFFEPADLPPAPPRAALARWSRSLASAAKTAEHPFNAGLMLEALVSEARTTLNSARRRP